MDEKALRARYQSTFVSATDPKRRAATLLGYSRAAARNYVEFVADLIDLSRRRAMDPFNLVRLQRWMLQHVIPMQRDLGLCKERLRDGNLADAERQDLLSESDMLATTTKAIREVGSGMVWRALGHDRAAYFLLGQGHLPSAIEGPGLLAESEEQTRIIEEQEGIPILSSLTNCVRIGDILVFSETDEGRRITVSEVKTKKQKTERFRRQRDRQNEVVTILNEGKGTFEKVEYRIAIREVEQENYLPAVMNLLQEARTRGLSGRTFDGYLRVDCVDFRSLREDPMEEIERQGGPTVQSWVKNGDLVIPMSNIEIKLPTVGTAPFSVYPFPSDLCAALLMNAMAIFSTINVTEILRRIEKHGWRIIEDPETIMTEVSARGGDPREAGLAQIEKGARTIALPPMIIARLAFEFLRPRALLRELDQVFKEGPLPEGERFLSYYPGEERTWR